MIDKLRVGIGNKSGPMVFYLKLNDLMDGLMKKTLPLLLRDLDLTSRSFITSGFGGNYLYKGYKPLEMGNGEFAAGVFSWCVRDVTRTLIATKRICFSKKFTSCQ